MTSAKKPAVDNPIASSDEDVLGRAEVAGDFAKSIRDLDSSQGVVVGVLGPWGHGKTSFINLMREEFAASTELPVVEFNPWLFSGSQQLTDVFFSEIAAELRIKDESKFAGIAKGLDEYGDVLSPIAMIPWFGAWWDRTFKAGKVAINWWTNRKKGSRAFRDQVTEALLALEQPIVVVIDDIDRLSTNEIRDIFKLVRLTASFPNVIYLLAFDRLRVEQALTDGGVSGRAYLEKIVQLGFDLPAIPREMLRSQIFEQLNPILDGVKDVRFNTTDWPHAFFEIIEPLIGNLRDVTRLVLSARTTIETLGSDIEAVDLLTLEAVRVFRPEIFQQIQKHKLVLTEVRDLYGDRDKKKQQAEVDEMLAEAGDDAEIVVNLIRYVFPMARRYTDNTHYGYDFAADAKREHRLAHIDYLDHYLERAAPSGLVSFRRSEKAFTKMTDATAFAKYIDSIKPEELEDTISGLEAYERSYPIEAIPAASAVLLNRIYKIPERQNRGMFDIMRPDLIVGRVVLRMLRRIEDQADREAVVRQILPELTSFSTQLDLLHTVGYREGAGHKLVGKEMAEALNQEFIDRVEGKHSPVPSEEWDLARVYWTIVEAKGDEYIPIELADPDEIRAFLTSARSVSRAQTSGSYVVTEEAHLWWDALVQISGGEQELAQAVRVLRETDGETALVELAEKYLGGWRPSRD
ncbi:KAP family P-loop NTPase fold protein [Microbacterium aurantiacum]|uniref:KAP family P-loop NTPase fold protein n=3 Tax=Microbacterium aurantiacum TaxID=162393 RepID=UPI004035E0C5